MSGVMNQMQREGENTVALFGADQWVVADGVGGPFTSSQLLDGRLAEQIASAPDVTSASPLIIGRTIVGEVDVNIVGYDPDSPLLPDKLARARDRTGGDGAIADVTLHRAIGDEIALGGQSIPITALVEDTAFFFSAPTVFLPLPDVQRLLFAGQDVVSTVMIQGSIDPATSAIDGVPLDVLTNTDVRADFDRVLRSTTDTIGIINILLWLMAAGIVAAIVYVGVLERTREFATLKAMGTTNRSLFGGLVLQAAAIAIVSALASVVVAWAVSPMFGFPVTVPLDAYLRLPIVAVVVGTLASLAGIRKITHIDPALAFGGAS
jgi:putative ABC transport system permease protein